MEIFTGFDQGSDEWFRARLGIPTASEFADVMAKGDGKTRSAYLYRLAGEIITGEPSETFSSAHMERGQVMEEEARNAYLMETGRDIERVSFIRNHGAGCSPDGLIGNAGAIEIKTRLPKLMVSLIIKGDVPPEHRAQLQGVLWIANRQWVDFVAYWPGFPLFVKRVERDNGYIATLAGEVARFNSDLAVIVEKVRRYGMPEAVAA